MAMRFPVQCSACQSGEKFKTNAGKGLCCAVLLCCGVLCCVAVGCVCVVSASLFCSFSREKRITFQDVRFSKPLTFHNDFMFFASRSCFKHFSRQQALPISHLKQGLLSRKVLETAARSKKHEIIVEGQRLRKANILEGNAFFLRK